MYAKLYGSIIIIAMGAYVGYACGERTKRELEVIKSLLRCIKMIESEIRYAGTPIRDIFSQIAHTGEMWDGFFLSVSDMIYGGEYKKSEDIWDVAVGGSALAREMNVRDRRELIRFFSGLGKNDIETELGRISLYTEYISERIETLSGEEAGKVKLFRVLGVTAALFITILIL